MRSIAALLTLTLQLRPLLGLALCLGLGRADVRKMEADCAMDEQRSEQVEMTHPSARKDASALTSADHPSSSGCALADACTIVSNAIVPAPSVSPAITASRGETLRSTDPVPDLGRFAPPTPPPNS